MLVGVAKGDLIFADPEFHKRETTLLAQPQRARRRLRPRDRRDPAGRDRHRCAAHAQRRRDRPAGGTAPAGVAGRPGAQGDRDVLTRCRALPGRWLGVAACRSTGFHVRRIACGTALRQAQGEAGSTFEVLTKVLPRQGEVACRRHDGGGGHGTEVVAYLPLRHGFAAPPPPGGGGICPMSIRPSREKVPGTRSAIEQFAPAPRIDTIRANANGERARSPFDADLAEMARRHLVSEGLGELGRAGSGGRSPGGCRSPPARGRTPAARGGCRRSAPAAAPACPSAPRSGPRRDTPVSTPISEMCPPTRTASIDWASVPGPPTSTT